MKRKILYLKSFPKQFENIGGMIKLEALFDKNNITVFCSASNDIDQKYVDGAKKVAQIISEKKYNLVYGGDSISVPVLSAPVHVFHPEVLTPEPSSDRHHHLLPCCDPHKSDKY